MLENIISSLRVFAPSSFTLVRYVIWQVHTSCLGCYLQTSLVTHVKTVSPYSASKLLLIDNVSNGCCGSQAKFEPYHSKTAQEYQQRYCLTDYGMTQCCINETCFLGETSTCRQGRVEIECMKIEQFENASLHFSMDRKKIKNGWLFKNEST